ncbi:MAG: hypothetical protein R3A78_15885 [Polyangiales bacterium]
MPAFLSFGPRNLSFICLGLGLGFGFGAGRALAEPPTLLSPDGQVVVVTDDCDPTAPTGACGGHRHRALREGKELGSESVVGCTPVAVSNQGKIRCGRWPEEKVFARDERVIRTWLTRYLKGSASLPKRIIDQAALTQAIEDIEFGDDTALNKEALVPDHDDTRLFTKKGLAWAIRKDPAYFGRPLTRDLQSPQPGDGYRLYALDIARVDQPIGDYEYAFILYFLLSPKHELIELRYAFFE